MTKTEFSRLIDLSKFVAGCCEGCGLEHNCTRDGCAVIRAAIRQVEISRTAQARAEMWRDAFNDLAADYKRVAGEIYLPGKLGRGFVFLDHKPKSGGGGDGV